MKKSKRIRVKIRKTKRAAIADMENALSVGSEVLHEMLSDNKFNNQSIEDLLADDFKSY